MYLIYSFRTLVIGYAHRFIDFTNCTYFFYVFIHPLVDRDRERVDTLYILVFVQYGFRVLLSSLISFSCSIIMIASDLVLVFIVFD